MQKARQLMIRTSDLRRNRQSAATKYPPKSCGTGEKGVSRLGPLRDGMWAGRRCFIVGGGPSVADFDLSLLRGELTIGINRAYEVFDPTIIFGMDARFWSWVESGEFGQAAKEKFTNYTKGYKVWLSMARSVYPDDFITIRDAGMEAFTSSLEEGIGNGNNSGYAALNLAFVLGADPIYLIGYDMCGDGRGNQVWFHDGYPTHQPENVYKGFISHISQRAVPVINDSGRSVINLNPNSSLGCFIFQVPCPALTVPQGVTIITPTGDRHRAFSLCQRWMRAQTLQPGQWIVVDDGVEPTIPEPFPGMEYVRRQPRLNDPKPTLMINIQTALPYIAGRKIIVIEDDEYYAPDYIATMAMKLDEAEVVGIKRSRYYHLPSGGWVVHVNDHHASLAQTAWRRSFLPDVANFLERGMVTAWLDCRIWELARKSGRGLLFSDADKPLYVGMKGLPGRFGIGVGHQGELYGMRDTFERDMLMEWMPNDYHVYMDLLKSELGGKTDVAGT